jgi:hypothetical protein
MMERWIAYIYERFPPLIYGSISLGVALSGSYLYKADNLFFAALLAFVGLWGFFFVLRLGNDINDLNKDRVAYPERPLPAGKISLLEARQALFLLQIVLFAYSQFLWIVLQGTAAALFLVLACWAWLANKRFYIKKTMLHHPLLSALMSPLCAVPAVFFAVSTGHPLRVFSVKAWALAAALYGAMLTYQLCRTINPHIHPIVANYIQFYGYTKTFYVATVGLVLSAVAAGVMHLGGLLWPIEITVWGTLAWQFYQPEQYRVPVVAAAVSLVVHAWAGIFM